MRWDAARVASRRPLPRERKMHGPVGVRMDTTQVDGVHARSVAGKQCWFGTENGHQNITACEDCGYHVCSCERRRPFECDRTLWCMRCLREYDVTPVGTPPERCAACLLGGDWWTREHRRARVEPIMRPLNMPEISMASKIELIRQLNALRPATSQVLRLPWEER